MSFTLTSSTDLSPEVGLTTFRGSQRIPISQVKPGSIILFGIDDDSVVIVLANCEMDGNTRELLLYGCFCELDAWEHMRLFTQVYRLNQTISIVLEPSC